MSIPDLESVLGKMLPAIAEKGGEKVKLDRSSSQLRFEMSRANGSGAAVEKFLLWHNPLFGAEYIVAYQLFDRRLLKFNLSGVPKILNGVPITKKDRAAFESFVELINVEAGKYPGNVINCQGSYPLARIPYFVARFYERMIPKP